jgi:hypothetical protein
MSAGYKSDKLPPPRPEQKTAGFELGTRIEVIAPPEGVHGFDVENDDATSRAIIRQAVEFIGQHLRA